MGGCCRKSYHRHRSSRILGYDLWKWWKFQHSRLFWILRWLLKRENNWLGRKWIENHGPWHKDNRCSILWINKNSIKNTKENQKWSILCRRVYILDFWLPVVTMFLYSWILDCYAITFQRKLINIPTNHAVWICSMDNNKTTSYNCV